MAENTTYYPVSDAGIGRIRSKLNQIRLGGGTVEPYEYTKLVEAEIGAQAKRADERRAEQLAQERFDKQLALSEKALETNTNLSQQYIDAAKKSAKDSNTASYVSAALKAPTAALTGYQAYKKLKKLLGGMGNSSSFPVIPEDGGNIATSIGTSASDGFVDDYYGTIPAGTSPIEEGGMFDITDYGSDGLDLATTGLDAAEDVLKDTDWSEFNAPENYGEWAFDAVDTGTDTVTELGPEFYDPENWGGWGGIADYFGF